MVSVPPRLLVFDLDGTLIDSSLDLCNSVNAALTHVGKPSLPNPLIASYIGDGAAMLVRRALGDPNDLDALHPTDCDELFRRAFDFFLTYYRAHKLDNTRCYGGVLDALTQIRSRNPGLPMAVLTNKPVNPSREICSALGLEPFFFQNYGGNSFDTKKPDPTGLRTIMRETGVTPEETVMIGDSQVDVETARNAGAWSIGCAFGFGPQTILDTEPDILVDRASDWTIALSPAKIGVQS